MDFATLKLGADTSALKQAEKALDDVAATATGTANKVDAANDKMDASFDQVGASAKQAAGSAGVFEKAMLEASGATNLATNALHQSDNAFGGAAAAATLAENGFEAATNALGQTANKADSATDELLKLQAAIRQNEAAGDALAMAQMKVAHSAENMAFAQAGAKVQIDAAKAALKAGDITLENYFMTVNEARQSVHNFAAAQKVASAELAILQANTEKSGTSSKLASHHVQNLAFQFQDLGVQLASGGPPLTAFIQQGSQIGGIMMQAGIGVRGLIAAVAGMIAPFTPAIAIVGGLAVAIGLMTEDINKNSKVTVTWTDTLLGSFDALKAALSSGIDAAFAAFGTTTTEVWQTVVNATRTAINFVIGAVVALPKAVYDAWTPLIAFADNLFVNVGNAIISRLNGLLSTFGQETFPLMKRSFADGGVGVGDALANSIKDSMSRNWLGDAAAALSPYAQERARTRLEEDAKKAGKKAGEKAGEGTVESLGEYIDNNTAKALNSLTKDFKFDDSALKAAGGQLDKMIVASGETFRTTMEGNLNIFRDVIVGISDLFGQGIGRTINQLGGMLEKQFPQFAASLGSAFKSIGKSIDSVLAGLGTSLGQLGQGASFGGAVGGLIGGSGRGAKGAKIGGSIGGALGSGFGPVGQIVGSVLGSLVGSLFKGKNPYADVALSATGAGTIFAQRGGDESAGAGRALGSAFSQELGLIAKALGGTVNAGANFGNIGFSGDQFYFNAQGGDFKGAGAQRFATAEEAVAAAIRNAVDKGAFEGLSETSKNILASVTEVNADAVVKAVERLNEARSKLVEAYNREADVLISTLERLQGFTANLESFRASLAEQLMTAEEIYQAARGRFEEISKAAIAGNEDAISQLVGVSQNYLSAAENFLSPEEYNREIENVMRAVDLAIVQTKTMEQYAQGQLDALNESVEALLAVDQSVVTVREAIDNLRGVMESFERNATSPAGSLYPQGGAYDGFGPMGTFDVGDPASFMAYTVSADEATRDELVKQNEYLRELVRIGARQERTLQEIQIQGEVAA